MNWDKPISYEDFWHVKCAEEVAKYHGKETWDDLIETIVRSSDNLNDYKLYEVYLNYCKLMNSPLGRALE